MMFINLDKIDKNKEINFDLRKKIILNVLIEFAKFCDLHNLKYSLAYGTLLGAVRHGGFIPWDDDVDVMMPREDYERFLKSYSSERFKIISIYNTKSFYLPFSKLYDTETIKVINYDIDKQNAFFGLEIDIFPFDYSDDLGTALKSINNLKKIVPKWNKSIQKYPNIFGVIKHPKFLIEKILYKGKANHYAKKFDNLSQIKYQEKKYTFKYSFFFGKKLIFEGDIFNNCKEIIFEGYRFKAISNYKDFLFFEYGDYMKLPPIEKRVTHHCDKAFYLKDI